MPKVKEEIAPEQVVEPEVQEESAQPTLEELQTQLEQAQEKITQTQTDLGLAKEEAKAHQRNVTSKDLELKEALKKPATSDSSLLQTVIEEMKAGETISGEVNPRRVALEAELAGQQSTQKYNEQLQYQETKIKSERSGLDKRISEAGLDPEDESLDTVYNAFTIACSDGDFSVASKRLDRVLAKVKPQPKSELTEDEEEEIARKVAEKKGLLTSETGNPSASSSSEAKIRSDYIADPNNPAIRTRYLQWRREHNV